MPEPMRSLAGHLLIAPREERDLDVIGAVILLLDHSEDQAVGVALNRPTTTTIKQAWRGKRRSECHAYVYCGGRVAGPLMALHTDAYLADRDVLPGIYYSVQRQHLEPLVCRGRPQLKVFQSHFGWGPGQLERLVEMDRWQIVPAAIGHVFHAGPGLWEEVMKLG